MAERGDCDGRLRRLRQHLLGLADGLVQGQGRGDAAFAELAQHLGVVFLELRLHPGADAGVEGAATEGVVAAGRDDAQGTVGRGRQHRDVQGAPAEVEHGGLPARAQAAAGGVPVRGGPRLGHQGQSAAVDAGRLRGLDQPLQFLAVPCLRVGEHDVGGRAPVIVAGRAFDDVLQDGADDRADLAGLAAEAHRVGADGALRFGEEPFRVRFGLVQRGMADHELRPFGEHRGRHEIALVGQGNGVDAVAAAAGRRGVGGTEVDGQTPGNHAAILSELEETPVSLTAA